MTRHPEPSLPDPGRDIRAHLTPPDGPFDETGGDPYRSSKLTPRQEATAYRLAAFAAYVGVIVLAGVFAGWLAAILVAVAAPVVHGFLTFADLVQRGGRIGGRP